MKLPFMTPESKRQIEHYSADGYIEQRKREWKKHETLKSFKARLLKKIDR